MQMTAAEARVALQAALATGNTSLILAARQVLASAEDGEDESVDGKKAKTKMKRTRKVTETEEMEAEPAEGEAESEAESEESEAEEGEESEAGYDGEESEAEAEEEPHEEPDGDEEPEEEEEEPAEKKAAKSPFNKGRKAKAKAAPAAKGDVARLLGMLGAKTMAEAIGRAAAAAESMAQLERLNKRLAKLEGEKRASKVERLFSAAQRDGRVVRAEVVHLKAAFRGRPLAELEAYLSAKPRVVSPEFAQESAAHYPSAPLVGSFASPGAQKAMSAFGVTPEQLAQRAAERGINPGFPGGSK